MSRTREAPAAPAEQSSIFDPLPCCKCHGPMKPHWLPNYEPPVWTQDHGSAKCGWDFYSPSRDALVGDWNAAQSTPRPQEATL